MIQRGNVIILQKKRPFLLRLRDLKDFLRKGRKGVSIKVPSKKQIEDLLLVLIVFLSVVFATLLLSRADFSQEKRESAKRAKLFASLEKINEAFYGISPFWLERYGIQVRSEEDTLRDDDGDGLTLKEEYLYLTNPLDPDTDKDGYNDGREVKNGYSPVGEGKLDGNGNGLPDSWEHQYAFPSPPRRDGDPDGDELTNEEEFLYGTNPLKKDTDGDGYNDFEEIRNGYDPDAPGDTRPLGEIIIEKIHVSAPIVFSRDPSEEALQKDLEQGVALFPHSASPGREGNMILTGHSSGYSWARGKYKTVFRKLHKLEKGDTFTVRTVQKNGRSFTYTYRVTEKFVTLPDDQRIFQQTAQPTATLVTCWPLNSDKKRLILRAELDHSRESAEIVLR